MPSDELVGIQKAAAEYIERGWQVVPLAPGSKVVVNDGWQGLIFRPEDFNANDNIGLRSVNGLIDIDCDADEVVALAPVFLPPTPAIYGRHGKPRHWLYISQFDKIRAFKDLIPNKEEKKGTLVEIRVNHQSMAPPSLHPDGGHISWLNGTYGAPAEAKPEDLFRAIQLLATSSMIARHYNPPGNRHDWGLALAGLMKRIGLSEAETVLVVEAAANFICDPDVKDRVKTVRSTYDRGDDEPTKGGNTLKELMLHGKEFLATLSRIWGLGVQGGDFITDAKGEKIIANHQENVARALKKLGAELYFDEFAIKPFIKYGNYSGPLEDRMRNRLWLDIDKTYHFRPSPDFFDVVIQDIADRNTIHPVRDYLKALVWDGIPRIDTWLVRAGNAADTEYVRSISAIVLVAAVRRVMQPGCKFDELMVLESGQGQFKSSMLRALCPNPEWFSDDLPLNVDAKQVIERTTGKWIIEAAELSGMRKSQREHLKSMLSRQVDGPVRMAYARLPMSQPRQFVCIGTTNDHHYLQDPTGNRRFWPVRVEKFNIELIKQEREQLWAEATVREAKGETIRLPQELYYTASLQQERRRSADPWEDVLEPFLDQEVVRIAPDELWEILGIPIANRDDSKHSRLIQTLQRFGLRKMTVKNRKGNIVKGWGKGEKQIIKNPPVILGDPPIEPLEEGGEF